MQDTEMSLDDLLLSIRQDLASAGMVHNGFTIRTIRRVEELIRIIKQQNEVIIRGEKMVIALRSDIERKDGIQFVMPDPANTIGVKH